MKKNFKKKVLDFLTKNSDKWFSIKQIADECSINWYIARTELTNLLHEEKVIVDNSKSSGTYWKLKDG